MEKVQKVLENAVKANEIGERITSFTSDAGLKPSGFLGKVAKPRLKGASSERSSF
jgi:hypothetical protein